MDTVLVALEKPTEPVSVTKAEEILTVVPVLDGGLMPKSLVPLPAPKAESSAARVEDDCGSMVMEPVGSITPLRVAVAEETYAWRAFNGAALPAERNRVVARRERYCIVAKCNVV